jgi:hypothetical protein
MTVLTVWTALLSAGFFEPAPVAVAYADSRLLDVRDPVVVRCEAVAGGENQELMPPQTMQLWEYVEGGDSAVKRRLDAFEQAFEADLHNHDKTFHMTHELIDGKQW